jgi:DNA-binding response OmpR family regulator
MSGETVLIADDDHHIVELVSLYLRRAGYRVAQAYDGDQALAQVASERPDLCILDVMMPHKDGIQVCKALRQRGNMPVVFLTARSSDVDKIAGLKMGADDYVTKPFNPDLLIARVEAVLRRSTIGGGEQPIPENLRTGALSVDVGARAASLGGQALRLTPKEFDLLVVLMRFVGTALGREQLLDLVWGTENYSLRTVDVHIARIREKLGQAVQIDTVWGTGYRLTGGT